MRIRKLLVALVILSLFIFIFNGCSDRTEPTVRNIIIKQNSFKASYEIDEKLNFANIFILATYSNGETAYVQCDNSMVKGFDTLTCGEKQLYVEYNSVKSEVFNYEVVYSIDNSKTIITSARLEFSTATLNEVLCYAVDYYCGDLINVEAVLFSVYGNQALNIYDDYSNLSFEMPNGWDYYVVSSSTQTLRVLFYNKSNSSGLSQNTSFIINVNKGNAEATTKLTDIEISTGGETASKYYLPDYTR